jgi:hypothetical protein
VQASHSDNSETAAYANVSGQSTVNQCSDEEAQMSDVKHTTAADPTTETAVTVNEVPDDGAKEAASSSTQDDSRRASPQSVTVNIPSSAFKRIKEQARERGRTEGASMAQDALDTAAKAAGFTSVEDAFAALAALKTQPAPAAPAPVQSHSPVANAGEAQPAAPSNAERAQLEAMQREWEAKIAAYQRDIAAAQARASELEEALTAKDAEIAIRDTLAKAGILDTDYAATLLARELASMDDEELASFSDANWVEQQRKDRPYLFGQGQPKVPATTGLSESSGAPSPEQVAQATAGAGQFDARTAKPQEFAERLRALGLSTPGFGARA